MSLFGLGSKVRNTTSEAYWWLDATLGSGTLREAVKFPPGEDFQ